MNIDTTMWIHNEKIRRFPNSVMAKKDRFYKEHSDIVNALRDITSWNDFAASLVNQFDAKGQLSEKQLFSASAMLTKIESKKEERQEVKKNLISLDVSRIKAILDKAEVMFPKIRVGDLVFSKASEESKNAGGIYIKYQKEYIGKVLGGYYLPFNNPSDEVVEQIKEVCKDPLESAIAYGKRTGNCAVCSRDLTRHDSIDRGIGPICAERLGII
jgi:hypothetical protein